MRADLQAQTQAITALTARIREVEERSADARRDTGGAEEGTGVATGWGPTLTRGAVHEWFGGEERMSPPLPPRHSFTPPLTILLHLAKSTAGDAGWIVWIGRHVWPYPRALAGAADTSLLERSVFIDPPTDADRLWAIDLALRNPAVACVVGDGSRLRMPESRRLQLAAAAGRALALLARPPRERKELSAARTRWRVRPEVAEPRVPRPARPAVPPLNVNRVNQPRWTVELLRDKGSGMNGGTLAAQEARRWSVWQDHETGDVSLVPDARHRSGAPARPQTRRTA